MHNNNVCVRLCYLKRTIVVQGLPVNVFHEMKITIEECTIK